MKIIVLIIFLLNLNVIYSQVPPLWSQSPSVQTGTRIIVNGHLSTTGSQNFTTIYTKAMNNPWVGLSIRQLRIVTYGQSIQFLSYIPALSDITNANFVHRLNRVSPTQIYYFEIGWIAYQGNLATFSDIKVYFVDTSGNGAAANPASDLDGSNAAKKSIQFKWNILPTVVAGHQYVVVAYLTGYKGSMNPTGYQANNTAMIDTVNNKIIIQVTVSNQTKIASMSFYIIICDITNLQVHSWTFVEGAITKAKNGIQYTFYTPSQILFTKNYISGLTSFTQANNIQYNFTIYDKNFTTRTDSLYNDVNHLNIWARVCPAAYPVYNTVDKLCYAFCPAGTYLVSQYALCRKCDYTCATCTSATSCTTCVANRVLDSGTNLCVCVPYYYQYNSVCIQCHYSCYTCQHSGQSFNCDSCNDAITYRSLSSGTNSSCTCPNGYSDTGSTICTQNCGDGIRNTDPCDDGNKDDGDGCSSTCQIQSPLFTCDPAINPTPCYFIGQLTIEIVRIQKDPNTNKATFYLKLNPQVKIMQKLNVNNMVTNINGAVFDNFQVINGYMAYTISYNKSFQDTIIVFGLKPTSTAIGGILSKFPPKNATILAKASNGLLLNYYQQTDYTDAIKLGVGSYVLGIIIFSFGFLFCYGDLKQIGLQLMFTIQFMFMTSVLLNNFDPYITRYLLVKHVMGYNDIMGQQKPPYMKIPVTQHMGYSVGYQYNFNIMVIMPGVSLLLYLIYRIALYRHQRKMRMGQTSKRFDQVLLGKILDYFKFQLFVYWMLFSMQQILMGLVLQSQYIQNGAIYIYIVLCLIGIVISILGLFLRPQSMQAYRKILFHKNYGTNTFLIILVSTLIMDLLLLLSVLVSKQIFYVLFVFPGFITIYIIARRPFLSIWNNLRVIILQLCMIVVLALQVVIYNTGYQNNKKYSIGIIVCIGICFIITLIVWLYFIIKKLCKKLKKDDDIQIQTKYSSKIEQQSINQRVRQAGLALIQGNMGQSRLPAVYQMRNMNIGNSRLRPKIQSYRVKPTNRQDRIQNGRRFRQQIPEKSPGQNNLRQKINTHNSKLTTRKSAYDNINNRNKARGGTGSDQAYDDNKVDQTSPIKDKSARRLNPYQQILDQTTKYK